MGGFMVWGQFVAQGRIEGSWAVRRGGGGAGGCGPQGAKRQREERTELRNALGRIREQGAEAVAAQVQAVLRKEERAALFAKLRREFGDDRCAKRVFELVSQEANEETRRQRSFASSKAQISMNCHAGSYGVGCWGIGAGLRVLPLPLYRGLLELGC